jgi:hypothetical protein
MILFEIIGHIGGISLIVEGMTNLNKGNHLDVFYK